MVNAVANGAVYPKDYSGPAYDAAAITVSDTLNNPIIFSKVYVGGPGDVSLVTALGNTVVFKAVPVGTILPVQCLRVNNTNTTASLLVGLI